MRIRMQMVLVGLLTGVLLEGAYAADPQAPPPGGPPQSGWHGHGEHHFGPHMPLAEFDLDKDGRVSRAEIDKELHARFAAADTNGDGFIDLHEFEQARDKLLPMMPHMFGPGPGMPPPDAEGHPPPPPPGDGPPPPDGGDGHHHHFMHFDPAEMFKHLDWNLDGKLSFEEFAAPVHEIALRLDRNGDGVIDKDELEGPGPRHQHDR